MTTAKASFRSFVNAFKDQWIRSMTGSVLAVVFMGISLWVSPHSQKISLFVLAVMSAMFAVYGVWSSERTARCEAEDKVNQFTSVPFASQRIIVVNSNLPLARAIAVSIANTGNVNFVVSAIEITVSDSKPLQEEQNVPFPVGGGSGNVFLPSFWRDFKINLVPSIDFQVRIQIKWIDRQSWLPPIVAHAQLEVSPNSGGLREIGLGYRTQRQIECPKCKASAVWMNVNGISSEDEFQEKKATFLEELRESCPQHFSQYALNLSDDTLGAYPGD